MRRYCVLLNRYFVQISIVYDDYSVLRKRAGKRGTRELNKKREATEIKLQNESELQVQRQGNQKEKGRKRGRKLVKRGETRKRKANNKEGLISKKTRWKTPTILERKKEGSEGGKIWVEK